MEAAGCEWCYVLQWYKPEIMTMTTDIRHSTAGTYQSLRAFVPDSRHYIIISVFTRLLQRLSQTDILVTHNNVIHSLAANKINNICYTFMW